MDNENRNEETFYESEKRAYEEQQSRQQEPEYQWHPYMSAGYNVNGQGMNGAPLDKNGNPMKNRFGLKLTASILEMLSFNLISFICGIIGCVFTVNANKAYKEARWEEFKTARKASAISLWIGFGAAIVYLILIIGFCMFVYQYSDEILEYSEMYSDYNYEDYEEVWDEDYAQSIFGTESIIYEDENAANGNTGIVISGEGFTTPEITVNGHLIELPLEFADLKEMGFSLDNEEYIINIGEYEYPDLLDENGDLIGYVYIANATEEPIACKDGVVFAIVLYLDEWQDVIADFELYNGITAETTQTELLEAFGSPDNEYAEEYDQYSYATYEWYMHHPYFEDEIFNSIDFTYVDGQMYEVGMYYIGW